MADEGLHLGLRQALRGLHGAAEELRGERLALTLLALHDGLPNAIKASQFTESSLTSTVIILSRLDPSLPLSRLVLYGVLGAGTWLENARHTAQSLAASLSARSAATKELALNGWLSLSLSLLSSPLFDRFELPYDVIQAEVEAVRTSLPAERSRSLAKMAAELADAIEALKRGERRGKRGGGGGGGARPLQLDWVTRSVGALAPPGALPEGSSLRYAPLLPRADELQFPTNPPANKTSGEYASRDEYVHTHFTLLREDFIRPLRDALNDVRAGREPPREVRLHRNVQLVGTHVGEPGGLLHLLRMESAADGEAGLINGSLVVLSADGWRTTRCAVVTKREAARLRADGSLYVSFQGDGVGADNHTLESAARDTALAIDVAALAGVPLEMLEAGAYWGAYRPVLAALQQAVADGGSLPMEDALLRCRECDAPPNYIVRGVSGYDVRPIFNMTEQATKMAVDVTGRWEHAPGSSLDPFQLEAAKALLTRRLALVQGPPGTGKTFIGLMVVRTLLRNTALWTTDGMAAQAVAVAAASAAAAAAPVAAAAAAPVAAASDRRMKAALDAAERMKKRAAERAATAASDGGGSSTGGTPLGKRPAVGEPGDAHAAKTSRLNETEVGTETPAACTPGDGTPTAASSPALARPPPPISVGGLAAEQFSADIEEETTRESLLSPTAAAATGRPGDAHGWLKHRIKRMQTVGEAAQESALQKPVDGTLAVETDADLSEVPEASDYPSDVPDELIPEKPVPGESAVGVAPNSGPAVLLAAAAAPPEEVAKRPPPILVLCHTNHALDQFLEGILKFEPRVVRVGGRSQSEELKAYNLAALLTERRGVRTSVEKAVVSNVHDQQRAARGRLGSALRKAHAAWGEEVLAGSQLRCDQRFRGTLASTIERMPEPAIWAWLSGAQEGEAPPLGKLPTLSDVHLEAAMTIAEVTECCDEAERAAYDDGGQTRASAMRLPRHRRWALYNGLRQLAQSKAQTELVEALESYRLAAAAVGALDEAEALSVLRAAAVVGMTTTGAAKYQSLIRQLGCRVVVFEEAAEVLEAHVLASLTSSTAQLLLIGDHQQLRPSAACHELSLNYGLTVSLFERALNNGVPFVRLRTQRRMRPQIARLIAPIYPELLDHPSVYGRPSVLAISHPAFFVTHSAPEGIKPDLLSPENPHEVDIILCLATFLIGLGYAQERITILSAYVGQLLLLRAGLTACGMDKVILTTVDAYQGEENDLVLLSLVRSNNQGRLGFTSVDNRICVALSRARLGFFCACNLEMLSAGSELWRHVRAHAAETGSFGPALPLDLKGASLDKPAAGERRPPVTAQIQNIGEGIAEFSGEPGKPKEDAMAGSPLVTMPPVITAPGSEWGTDWRSAWMSSMDALTKVAANNSGVMATCSLTLPCGHQCRRVVHLPPARGGCFDCICAPCHDDVQFAESERRRWRPLQEALNMRSRQDGRSEIFAPSPAKRDTPLTISTAAAEGNNVPQVFSPTSARLPATLGGTMPSEKDANMPYITQVARAKNYAQATAPLRVPASYFAGEGGKFTSRPPPRNFSAEWSDIGNATPPAARPLSTPPPEGLEVASNEGALPAAWQKATSKSHGQEYYYCQATGERTWSISEAHRLAAAATAAAGTRKSALSGSTSAQPLWKEFFSKTHSQPYWVNRLTKETTWRKPDDVFK